MDPNGLGPDLAAQGVFVTFAISIHSEHLWIPDGLGPDLAARPEAARMFEMLAKSNHLERLWMPDGLGPVAARSKAERLFKLSAKKIVTKYGSGPNV